jgi:DNA-binding transcriptional regulator WhiA
MEASLEMSVTTEQANAYIQGVLAGDGYIDNYNSKHPRISLCTSNEVFAKIFGKMLITIGITPTVNHRQRKIVINQEAKNYRYNQHTIYVRSSLTPQKVAEVINAPIDTQEKKCAYIQGILDSDGSCFNNRQYKIVTITKRLPVVEKVKALLTELGINATIYTYQRNKASTLKICQQESVSRFYSLIKPKFQWGLEDNERRQPAVITINNEGQTEGEAIVIPFTDGSKQVQFYSGKLKVTIDIPFNSDNKSRKDQQ